MVAHVHLPPAIVTERRRIDLAAAGGLRVLVADDEAEIRRVLTRGLARAGCHTHQASSGREALEMARTTAPDLMLLDMVLGDLYGLEVLRQLKADPATRDLPVIIVSGQDSEDDIVDGLLAGAEDYITKPIVLGVLLARVQAVVRRTREPRGASAAAAVIGAIEIDPERHEVRVQGQAVPLTVAQFRLIDTLATAPGRVYTRDELIERALGEESDALHRTVDVHICAIRKALGPERGRLVTVRGVGYRLDPGEG